MGMRNYQITACTLDCPDGCSLLVVTDAQGKVTIRGNPEHPFTAGFTCRKIRRFVERLRSPSRVTRPMLRKGEGWQPISWEEALELCAAKLQEYRAEPAAILHFHGEAVKGALKQSSKLFFARLGASQVRGSLCDAAGYVAYVADFGSRKNHDPTDLLKARRIVNWGKDLSRSSIHTAALIRKARQQGARLLTISPGGDGNAPFSDELVRIRPGSDRFLAAAVLHGLITEGRINDEVLAHTANWKIFREIILCYPLEQLAARCEVTSLELKRLQSWYLDSGPTATFVGAGLQRYRFGGENVRFINALAFLSGNIGRSGGGSTYHLHSLRTLNLDWTRDPENKPRRWFLKPVIGRSIIEANDPPVRMIWVNASNVINQAPDSREIVRAFSSIPFKVVVDAFMTDTAEHADLFLPCSLMFEEEDVGVSYLHDFVHHVKQVFLPPREARSDHWILTELGKRLDPPILLPAPEICLEASLKSPQLSVSLEELREKHFVRARSLPVAYAGLHFDHPDGKYRLPTELHEEPPAPAAYPLRLLTLIRRDAIHSQILPEEQTELPTVWISPECTCLGHLKLDEEVYLVSPLGRLRVKVEITPGLHPEVVLYRRGDWMKLGGGVNQLIAAELTDIGNGAPYYQQYVRLENTDTDKLKER
jgi:anaerobic selenocysteine-containing dehydrogenase